MTSKVVSMAGNIRFPANEARVFCACVTTAGEVEGAKATPLERDGEVSVPNSSAILEGLRREVPMWRREAQLFMVQAMRQRDEGRSACSDFVATVSRAKARESILTGLRLSRNAARVERGELPDWGAM